MYVRMRLVHVRGVAFPHNFGAQVGAPWCNSGSIKGAYAVTLVKRLGCFNSHGFQFHTAWCIALCLHVKGDKHRGMQ